MPSCVGYSTPLRVFLHDHILFIAESCRVGCYGSHLIYGALFGLQEFRLAFRKGYQCVGALIRIVLGKKRFKLLELHSQWLALRGIYLMTFFQIAVRKVVCFTGGFCTRGYGFQSVIPCCFRVGAVFFVRFPDFPWEESLFDRLSYLVSSVGPDGNDSVNARVGVVLFPSPSPFLVGYLCPS